MSCDLHVIWWAGITRELFLCWCLAVAFFIFSAYFCLFVVFSDDSVWMTSLLWRDKKKKEKKYSLKWHLRYWYYLSWVFFCVFWLEWCLSILAEINANLMPLFFWLNLHISSDAMCRHFTTLYASIERNVCIYLWKSYSFLPSRMISFVFLFTMES